MKLNYFNFKFLKDKILITNDFGKYMFVTKNEFMQLIKKNISTDSELYRKLIDMKMIYDESDLEFSSTNRYDLRTAKGHVSVATSLHIFVVTTACNMKCVYCQANNGINDSNLMMTEEIAEKSVDIALQSPAKYLTFEFQGGEPLINFDIVKHIVEYAELNKGNHIIDYNIVTNLTLLNDEILDYFETHKFGISTSIDGNRFVHNQNRIFVNGKGTYDRVVESIQKIKNRGLHVGAIQTTTRYSLPYPKEIVQTYKELGFDSIFVRPLTPLGKAAKYWDTIGYTPEEFIRFYKEAFEEIIKINREGRYFKENHATILINRMNGCFINYMELRSPCGAGIGQLAYYADGNIFTCDEARMIYEMGQDTFKLGNVYTSSYKDLVSNTVCKTVCTSSVLESLPTCTDCVYQAYCGSCPVVNYALYNDLIEKQPRGYKCKIYSGILDTIFTALLENEDVNFVFDLWRN